MTKGAVVFITGLPSSGKSKFARAMQERLKELGTSCCRLDGDEVRGALVPRPAYDASARDQFYETLGNLAALLAEQGLLVLVAATAHRRAYRERARAKCERFLEVWIDVALEECRRRDAKGLYTAFAEGRTQSIPGEDLAYEPPLNADVVAHGGADLEALNKLTALLTQG